MKHPNQERIFIYGALGYLKLGALLEGLRRLMSYKAALHVLVTFTEQLVPIHKHIYFILKFLNIWNQSLVSRPSYPQMGATLSQGPKLQNLIPQTKF